MLLIDPPVGPFSLPADIREWVAELEQMRQRAELSGDADEIAAIDRATARATGWLQ